MTAERGAWDFKITLDVSDKISGLSVTPPGSGPAAVSVAAAPPCSFRFGSWYVFWGGDNEKVNNHVSARGRCPLAADLIIKSADDLSHKRYPVRRPTKITLFTGSKSCPQPPAPSSPRSTASPITSQAP